MVYRAAIEAEKETVSVMNRAGIERLQEATLLLPKEPHSAVYLAGLAAEMLLKTALCMVVGATAADLVRARLGPIQHHTRNVLGIPKAEEDSGHSIFYWYQQLVRERAARNLRTAPNRMPQIIAHLYTNWKIDMRYHPDTIDPGVAHDFVRHAHWLQANYNSLRS